MDRRAIVNRLSKLFYLRKEPFAICANRLLRFGYQDIEIDIPICENSRDSKEYCAEIRKMTINFRHQNYQYHVEAQCADGHAAPDNIYRIFSKIIEYITNPEEMHTVNIGREYPIYLAEQEFVGITEDGEVSSNTANLVAFRENTKYRMTLHRSYGQTAQMHHYESGRFIETDPEKNEFYLNRFQQNLEQGERLYEFQGEHHIELAKDLSQLHITLFRGWSRSQLSISSEPLSVQVAEELFQNVVRCWMRAECKNELLTDNIICYGHVPQNFTDNQNSFEVLYNGIKYSISTRKDELVNFDHMDGHTFEYFCAEVLSLNGFSDVEVTQGSRDQGVDIIAYKDDIKYGIQCKCYSSDIGNKAVQEVYAGKNFYNCDVAAVLTNRYFTKSAVELAQKNRVHLWDRGKLSELIENCKENLLGNYRK